MKIIFTLVLTAVFQFVSAQSIGGATSGSTAFCTSQNAGFISLSGYTGDILYWESSVNNGASWTNIGNQTSSQSYFNLSQTTMYRVIIKSGSFPTDTSTSSKITVHIAAQGGTINGGGAFCMNSGTGFLTISGSTGTVNYWEQSTNNGNTWSVIQNTLTAHTYSNISVHTLFRAVVSNVPGCPSDTSSIAAIKIDQNSVAGFVSGEDTVCNGSKKNALTVSGLFGNITDWFRSDSGISWQALNNVNDTLIIETKKTYSYRVEIKNGACPSVTTSPLTVFVPSINPASAGEDQTMYLNEMITLKGNGNGIPRWTDDNSVLISNQFTPLISPEKTTLYTLTIVDEFSCLTYDSVRVNVIIPVPNAITPNNDNVNDYFMIDKIETYPNSNLQIFNKWGMLVFSASPYLNNFNGVSSKGKELPDEIYYYTLDLGDGEKPRKDYILIKR